MIVIVDSNEQATNPRIVDKLREVFPHLAVSKLTCGDINVITDSGKTIAIERKEVGDLLGSIADGRVFRQVENMAMNSNYSAIVTIGKITYDREDMVVIDDKQTNWKGKSVRAAIADIMWSACPVIQASDSSFPYVVRELVQFCDKPAERKQLKPRPVYFPPVPDSTQILAGLPGVGLKRAESLLYFVGRNGERGTLIDALIWATALDLLKEDVRPEGWGSGTIRNVREALGLKEGERLAIHTEMAAEAAD